MAKITDEQYKKIFEEGFRQAKLAETEFRKQYGEPMYCGFAWVNITKGQTKAINADKRIYGKDQFRYGHKGYRGGWDIWNPGGSGTQSMDIKESGARAMAAYLRSQGIDAYPASRAD